ncbi:hypothetical protein FBEOM_14100, partial [Fusarium beomiforme]
MSFFKKITKEFENLGIGGDKKEETPHSEPPPAGQGQRGYGYYGEGGQGGPPPAQYYAAPPQPAYQPPSDKPPLPEGWTSQFDQQSQRWYYVELATGRTQWEAPGQHYTRPSPLIDSRPPMYSHPSDGSRSYTGGAPGYGSPTPGYGGAPGYGSPAPGYGGTPGYGGHDERGYGAPPGAYGGDHSGGYGYGHESDRGEHKEKSGKGDMLLGAAGGLAVGVVGGALIANALNDSDEEHHAPPPAPPADYGY